MILLLLGCVAAVTLVAVQASGPATDASRRRSAARRARFVAANPTHVNSADIVAGLCVEGLAPGQARFVTDHALAQGIKPFTMWLWLEQFGAEAFSIVVAADLTQGELLTHISNGTVPDMDELRLFATANGLDLDTSSARHHGRSRSSARTRRRPMSPVRSEGGRRDLAA